MKREVMVGVYFMIYIALPTIILHYLQLKYPELAGSVAPFYTMVFLIIIFISSIASLYTKYSSIPVGISAIATIVYLNFVLGKLHLELMGAEITIDIKTMLYAIYLLLALKIMLAIYGDVKQKGLSPRTHKGVQ